MRRIVWNVALLLTASAIGEPQHAWYWQHGPAVGEMVKLVELRDDETYFPVNVNNWWGLMNPSGRLTAAPRFDWTDYSEQGLSRAVQDGRTGFVDGRGEWILPPRYPWADRFAGGYAIVGEGDRVGFIDRRGEVITPRPFDAALRFSDGLAAVGRAGRHGFIDARGEVVIDLQFAQVSSFRDGIAMVQFIGPQGTPGRFAFIGKTGEVLWEDTSGSIWQASPVSDGMIRVQVDGRWGYLNRAFKPVIPPRFTDARDFHDGFAAAARGGRWGFIDKTGAWAIPPRFEDADDFQEGVAWVQLGAKAGLLDKAGRWIIEPVLPAAEPFRRDYARVAVAGSFGYIDKRPKLIWDPREADEGFVDLTIDSVVNAHLPRERPRGLRLIPAPPLRDPVYVPYRPEHLYYPVLPERTPR